MYAYTYSAETGGLLLRSVPDKISKEPRPVYAPELDLLGFDRCWTYDRQTAAPYMWAEAHKYLYRGRLVAQLLGGDVYHAPEIRLAYVCDAWRETPGGKAIPKTECQNPGEVGETYTDKRGNVFVLDPPEPQGTALRPVDVAAMTEENREILGWLEETTAKKILAVYEKYADRLDVFHVAFSGGKDSCVLLELVKSVLPHDRFVVVFGDTGMEFPDTYDVIDRTEARCREAGIRFYRAASHLSPAESWALFAPPSRVLRWCCSVHKSAPQTLKLREVTGKQNYTGLDYVGVRAEESAARSEYEYENYGKKQKGQYSHNAILEWTSAEVWLFIYAHDILINEAYKKGSARAGCLCCPMGGGKAGYVEQANYPDATAVFYEKIKGFNSRPGLSAESFVTGGGWRARKNGRDIPGNVRRCLETVENGRRILEAVDPASDWTEWVKTLSAHDQAQLTYEKRESGFAVSFAERLMKANPLFGRLVRQTVYKAAYCHGCKVCQANCPNGCIRFENGEISITDCTNCHECHQIASGCLLYHSLKHPTGGGKMKKSINTMANHAPKTEWFESFFENGNDFFSEHTLGPQQISRFKSLLRAAGLQDKNACLPFFGLVRDIGWNTDTAMGLILVNLAYENAQTEWYINHLDVGRRYDKKSLKDRVVAFDVKPEDADSVVYAFKRLVETPLGTKLKFGYVDGNDMARTTCSVSDPRVVLYALYKFAEKCYTAGNREFRLRDLLSDGIERDGVSPTRVFGLDREAMTPLLLGLSANHPDFIYATFTNDLDKISLRDDKTSADVLNLFRGN